MPGEALFRGEGGAINLLLFMAPVSPFNKIPTMVGRYGTSGVSKGMMCEKKELHLGILNEEGHIKGARPIRRGTCELLDSPLNEFPNTPHNG